MYIHNNMHTCTQVHTKQPRIQIMYTTCKHMKINTVFAIVII